MADNTTLNTGAGGDTIATDDLAGVKYQRVKVNFGSDGSATDVSSASPLPVDTELTTVDADTGAGTDTRAGVVLVRAESGGGTLVGSANPLPTNQTAALPAGNNNIGDVDIASNAETIADNGGFTDGTTKLQGVGFVFDEVAGTALTENDIAAARVDSKRAQVAVIEDETTRGRRTTVTAANALKVDGSAVTQPVSGTVTVNGTITANAGTGTLNTSDQNTIVDNNGFTDGTSRVFPTGYVFDEVAGTALTENDIAAARVDSKRAQVGVLEDATTRGQRAAVSAAGRLSVDASGVAVPVTDNAGSLTVDAPVGTPVFVRLSDGAATLIGQKTMASSLPVVIASDQSALTLTTGTASIGDVGIRPRTSNGLTKFHLVSAGTTNATNIKASAGQVFGWYISNRNASNFMKVAFHDSASAPTAGASIYFTVDIPPSSAANVFSDIGVVFASGIGITTVTGAADSDATAVAANDLNINIFYA